MSNMKLFVIFTVLAVAAGLVVADTDAKSLLGDQVALLKKIEAHSKDGRYEEAYRLLGADYRSVVTEAQYVEESRRQPWSFERTRVGTVYEHSKLAYVPVRGEVRSRGRVEVVDSVAFFVKEDGEWKLLNFPFLPGRLPNFAVVPEWLE